MLRNSVTLIKTVHGYLWAERGRYYKTLASAKSAVKRDAKSMVKSPVARGVVATMLEIYDGKD
jgi:hypothetical protein